MFILAAVIPTVITILALITVIRKTKHFDRVNGEISDLNIRADTRYTLFVIFVFWESCQTAFLMLTHSMLSRAGATPMILLMASLMSGLVGILFRSRTAGHQILISLSVALSVVVMMMESVVITEFVVIAVLAMTGIYLLRSAFTGTTPNYWKLEIIILVCYALWNSFAAMALR